MGADAAPWAESTACGGPVMIQPVGSNPDRPEGSDGVGVTGRPPAAAQRLRRALHCRCKENGPLTHLLWILVFDDQHNQIGLMNLHVIVLQFNKMQDVTWTKAM